jgi:hypothetical protein
MDYSDLDFHYKAHIKKQKDIYEELRQQLIDQYLKEGFLLPWAEVKAKLDILELRSLPKHVLTMHIPPEQTTQGDLD